MAKSEQPLDLDQKQARKDIIHANRYELDDRFVIRDGKKHKCAIVCPGGGYFLVCSFIEGVPIARKLNEQGISVIIAYYRVKGKAKFPNPQDDLARAVREVYEKKDYYNLDMEDYSVWGSSAGGHLVGSFGTTSMGYKKYGLPKPGLLVLIYPVISLEKEITHQGTRDNLLGKKASDAEALEKSIHTNVDGDYPATFIWCGTADSTVPPVNTELMKQALEKNEIEHLCTTFEGVEHGVGPGTGTNAEGWMDQAVDYWKSLMKNSSCEARPINMAGQAVNPYLPSYEYVPDGEPRVFGDRLYVYGSHDAFNGADFCINDYVCYSAPLDNLADWRYEGIIYRASQDPKNSKGNQHMCAPDCIEKNGKYYLYYQLHMMQCTSVAVADNPTGPFEFYGYVQHQDGTPWGEKKGDAFAFDPATLVDDDGRNYLYVGFTPDGPFRNVFKLRGNMVDHSVCLELADDMKTVVGQEMPMIPGTEEAKGTPYEGHSFFEASSIRKVGAKYYFVYSSILSHELCYAVSDYPDRDFVYGGTLVSIADIGYEGNTRAKNYTGNTHGGMIEVNGQWYIFYHRQSNKIKCSRQACAEKITIESDGRIRQAEVTSCGLNDGPLAGRGSYAAYIACNLFYRKSMLKSDTALKEDKENEYPYFTQSGVDREDNPDQYIANMRDTATAGFKYFQMDGAKQISVETRGIGQGTLEVWAEEKGSDKKKIAAKIPVSPSAGWTTCQVSLKELWGEQALYFRFKGEGAIDFNSFEIL